MLGSIFRIRNLIRLCLITAVASQVCLAQNVVVKGTVSTESGQTPIEPKVVLIANGIRREANVDPSNGEFIFERVSQVSFNLVACAGINYVPMVRDVEIEDGKSPPPIGFTLSYANNRQQLSGPVKNRKGVEVLALAYECEVARTKVNEQGRYKFENLPKPPDKYRVAAVGRDGRLVMSGPISLTDKRVEVALSFSVDSKGATIGLSAEVLPLVITDPLRNRGDLAGHVVDPNGAPAAGFTISATNRETGETITTTTNEQGEYLANVPVGVYDVRVEGGGFSVYRQENIVVAANQRSNHDIALKSPPVRNIERVVAHSIGGSIEGVVTDTTGAAVPGITVTAKRQGGPPMTATSTEEGYFRFLSIEPGTYTITIEAEKGFGKFEQTSVEVNLSKTSALNVQLRPQGATETVTVTAGSGAIDVTQNTTGTNVSTEQFSNFPTQRTVQSLYTIAPTVTRSGLRDSSGRDRDLSVAGSSGPENNYLLDGVSVSNSAFGGSGANLPFEFVQEVEIKTGAYSADTGRATGGVFNITTKSGSNEFHGDAFGYFVTDGLVRQVKSSAIPRTGAAPNGYSEVDAGFDIGGRIVRDKLFFFGVFNPQRRKNFFLTQTLLQEVENELTTPFYAGKLTWHPHQNYRVTFYTFGDHTKQEGYLFGSSGFGAKPKSFRGETQTGGSNYAFRLNSTFTPNFVGEFSVGLHFQRSNTIPDLEETLIVDRFAVLRNGEILAPIETTVVADDGLRVAFVDGIGGSVQRNFVRSGFGLKSLQDRGLYEVAARLQTILGKHTLKWGFEFTQNRYRINTGPTGTNLNFNAEGIPIVPYTIENLFAICRRDGNTITCPDASRTANVLALINAGQAPAGVSTAVTGDVEVNTANPFLLLDVVRARAFTQNTRNRFLRTNTESFYIQGDLKLTNDFQFNVGARWDYQQLQSVGMLDSPLSLNNFISNLQPRIGFAWDFTSDGRSKIFTNYARFIEAPIPLQVAIRASGSQIQNDFNLNVSRLNGGTGAAAVVNFGNLSNQVLRFDRSVKPQSVDEWTAGVEWSPSSIRDLTLSFRGIYRAQDEVIEDGSFDDGITYFIFNPKRLSETPEAGAGNLGQGNTPQFFGPARRYYRALEFSATKRFSNNYQFVASYVYSSLIGNYEGLFRDSSNQPRQSITKLFDLVSLISGHYGRLPNDHPHQIKVDGSYSWPFGLVTSASFRAQSGVPFNALVPHPLYGDNQGFCIPELSCVPRGTAINPLTGSNRTPATYNFDLGANYVIQLRETLKLKLQLDWFNVFNNQRPVRMDETFLINSGAFGIPPVPNPFHGTGTIFQFPAALRLGVKFQF